MGCGTSTPTGRGPTAAFRATVLTSATAALQNVLSPAETAKWMAENGISKEMMRSAIAVCKRILARLEDKNGLLDMKNCVGGLGLSSRTEARMNWALSTATVTEGDEHAFFAYLALVVTDEIAAAVTGRNDDPAPDDTVTSDGRALAVAMEASVRLFFVFDRAGKGTIPVSKLCDVSAPTYPSACGHLLPPPEWWRTTYPARGRATTHLCDFVWNVVVWLSSSEPIPTPPLVMSNGGRGGGAEAQQQPTASGAASLPASHVHAPSSYSTATSSSASGPPNGAQEQVTVVVAAQQQGPTSGSGSRASQSGGGSGSRSDGDGKSSGAHASSHLPPINTKPPGAAAAAGGAARGSKSESDGSSTHTPPPHPVGGGLGSKRHMVVPEGMLLLTEPAPSSRHSASTSRSRHSHNAYDGDLAHAGTGTGTGGGGIPRSSGSSRSGAPDATIPGAAMRDSRSRGSAGLGRADAAGGDGAVAPVSAHSRTLTDVGPASSPVERSNTAEEERFPSADYGAAAGPASHSAPPAASAAASKKMSFRKPAMNTLFSRGDSTDKHHDVGPEGSGAEEQPEQAPEDTTMMTQATAKKSKVRGRKFGYAVPAL